MSTPQNPFAQVVDLTDLMQRSQRAGYDALEAWAAVAQAVGDATGSQARNLRQIVHGLFDLADQGFTVEREVANYLTIASRVSAAAADSLRELSDIGLTTVEGAARTIARSR